MKRFKIGFLAVIAVLAMSFTVADYNKVFVKKVKKVIANCYGTLSYRVPSACASNVTITVNSTACTTADDSEGNPLWTSPSLNSDPACGETGSFYCCATLATTSALCTAHPQVTPEGLTLGRYKIDQVFCRNIP
jgi:hypothetical protein